jgi:hypothetical protein
MEDIMPCNQNCNQGRLCDCKKDANVDRATVVVVTLIFIAFVSMGFGLYKLVNGNKGQDCQIEVQFQDSKATYIGKTV